MRTSPRWNPPRRARAAPGWVTAAVLLAACDADGDGARARFDCDDRNPDRAPSHAEVCDGVDNDCDGVADEGVMASWYRDGDGDGEGRPGVTTEACTQPSGYAGAPSDCDDGDPAVGRSAAEVCDGVDNDCDGAVDVDVPLALLAYQDVDGDGAGDLRGGPRGCVESPGLVRDAGDCDDADATTYPGAGERCDLIDNDCDGQTDERCR